MAETTVQAVPQTTPLQRVEELRSAIATGGDQAQQLRHAPQETIDALVDAGLFRFTIPRDLGGEDASSLETIEVIEAASAIDGSIGWNLMLGSEINAMAAGGMDPAIAREIYLDDPGVIMCGGGGPGTMPGRAEPQPDGSYRVWGQSSFISGCHGARWCFMVAPIVDNGTTRLDDDGAPVIRMWFLHRDQWEIVDTWDMAGLRGSGSHDVRATGALVPERLVDVDLVTLPPRHPNPVYRIPVPLRLSYNKAACALGIARGALDTVEELAQTKVPLLSTGTLRDRPIAQHRIGVAEAELRAARAFVFEAMGAVEDELHAGADIPGAATTQQARLACVHAANVAMQVVDTAHNVAGTSAARMNNPLERKLRDAHACASHRWVSHALYTDLGRIFLGHPPAREFAGTPDAAPR